MNPSLIAVVGAGLIGQRHIEEVDASSSVALAAIVEPFPAATEIARKYSMPLFRSLAEVFEKDKPNGVIDPRSAPPLPPPTPAEPEPELASPAAVAARWV